jgi:hypothetical protein
MIREYGKMLECIISRGKELEGILAPVILLQFESRLKSSGIEIGPLGRESSVLAGLISYDTRNVKGKVVHCLTQQYAMKAMVGSAFIAPCILNLSTGWNFVSQPALSSIPIG